MKHYCEMCEEECELRGQINFCQDCAEYTECTIGFEVCKKGHAIECNNGFEIGEDYYPYPEYNTDGYDYDYDEEDTEE